MKPSRIINLLGPWGWAVAAVGLVLAVWLVVWLIGAPQREADAKFNGAVAEELAKAATDNGKSAVDITGKNAAREAAIEQRVETDNEAIRLAKGAGVDVDTAVDLAGRCAVCVSNAAKRSSRCVELYRTGACNMVVRSR